MACLAVLLAFANDDETSPLTFWIRFGVAVFLLCNLNYMGFLFAPVFFFYAVHVRRETIRGEARQALAMIVLLALACAWEFVSFLDAVQNAVGSQTGSILRSTPGVFQGILVNSGIFPLSVQGAFALIGITGTALVVIVSHWQAITRDRKVWLAFALVSLLIVTGIGVKFRNVTPILPLILGIITFYALLESRYRRLKLVGLSLIGVANLLGCINLLQHEGTAKGSWNTPALQVVRILDELSSDCDSTFVFTRDPLLAYHTSSAGYPVLTPNDRISPSVTVPAGACMAGLITFRGSMDRATFDLIMTDLSFEAAQRASVGRDPYVAVKRWFDQDIPDYYVDLKVSKPLETPMRFDRWKEEVAIRD